MLCANWDCDWWTIEEVVAMLARLSVGSTGRGRAEAAIWAKTSKPEVSSKGEVKITELVPEPELVVPETWTGDGVPTGLGFSLESTDLIS